MAKIFKIMNEGFPLVPSTIPFSWVAPFGAQALRNHNQTLDRLTERGGLSVSELLAVIENRQWERMDSEDASKKMLAWIHSHEESEKDNQITALTARAEKAEKEATEWREKALGHTPGD